jgi:hypothetical protein
MQQVGIEPTIVETNGFTIRRNNHSATAALLLEDLNPQPMVYKTIALPIKLKKHNGRNGI